MNRSLICWGVFLICALMTFTARSMAGPFDSIPVASNERVLLDQPFTVPATGAGSNLFIPERANVSFDYAVEPGKQLLLMVITQEQADAVNAGEKPSGDPLLRVTVSGVGTEAIVLDRGSYMVALLAVDDAPSTQVAVRARARAD